MGDQGNQGGQGGRQSLQNPSGAPTGYDSYLSFLSAQSSASVAAQTATTTATTTATDSSAASSTSSPYVNPVTSTSTADTSSTLATLPAQATVLNSQSLALTAPTTLLTTTQPAPAKQSTPTTSPTSQFSTFSYVGSFTWIVSTVSIPLVTISNSASLETSTALAQGTTSAELTTPSSLSGQTTDTAYLAQTNAPTRVGKPKATGAGFDPTAAGARHGLSGPQMAVVVVIPIVITVLCALSCWMLWARRRRRRRSRTLPIPVISEKKVAPIKKQNPHDDHGNRPRIPAVPPMVILPNSSSHNPAYNLGIDTSEAISDRSSSHGSMYRGTSVEEPPPPYNAPIHSAPPLRTPTALPPGHLEEQGRLSAVPQPDTLISPFADPDDSDAASTVSYEDTAASRPSSRRSDDIVPSRSSRRGSDTASTMSEISYRGFAETVRISYLGPATRVERNST